MKTSTLILGSLIAAALALGVQPGLAQPAKGEPIVVSQKSNKNDGKSSRDSQWNHQEQKSGDRDKQRPDQGKKGGDRDKQRPDQSHKGSDKRWDRDNHDNKKEPVHNNFDHKRARNMAQAHHVTGYKPLPPDMRKRMVLNRPMPRDIVLRDVPPGMRPELPPRPGYEWRIAGSDLVLVAVGTLIIHEIIENVFN